MSQPFNPASVPETPPGDGLPPRTVRTAGEGATLKRACTGLLVFYGLALALNAGSLHENNVRRPYGRVRTFWMTLSAPAAEAFATLRLDRPRAWLEKRMGAPLNAP